MSEVNRVEETEKDKSYYAITIGGQNIISNFPHKQQPLQFKNQYDPSRAKGETEPQYVEAFINRFNDKNKVSSYYHIV